MRNDLQSQGRGQRLHLWLIILAVSLLFTVVIWDHYVNSDYAVDRSIVSNLVLLSGTLFSVAVSLAAWVVESSRDRLGLMVEEKTEKLDHANQEITALQGFLPLCAWCKKVRDDKGYWQQLEIYLQKSSGTQVSHGICEDCKKKVEMDSPS